MKKMESEDNFPEREEAMRMYKLLFALFLECHDKGQIDIAWEIGRKMDTYQEKICAGPCLLWTSFISTIPHYKDWWDDAEFKMRSMIEAIKRQRS